VPLAAPDLSSELAEGYASFLACPPQIRAGDRFDRVISYCRNGFGNTATVTP
jgi:hypothetical protein